MKVILDANVLYPAPLRDMLLSLANNNMFQPKWSTAINEEWVRNLIANRPDIKRENTEKTIRSMNMAFPDANTEHYASTIAELNLPDPNDQHVLAAAISAEAELIVTFNLKDFPPSLLAPRGIEAIHPDDFILGLIEVDKVTAFDAFEKQVARLKNPPLSRDYVLDKLNDCNLPKTAASLRLPITM